MSESVCRHRFTLDIDGLQCCIYCGRGPVPPVPATPTLIRYIERGIRLDKALTLANEAEQEHGQ